MERYILLLVFLFFISVTMVGFAYGDGDMKLVCNPSERQALLSLKQGFVDPSNRLSSWTGQDCCSWMGIQCRTYNATRHVIRINLQNPYGVYQNDDGYNLFLRSKLSGGINPSLLDLKYLDYLNLSYNGFGGIPVPEFFGSLKNLRYLDLSKSGFAGIIPPQLGNLTNLLYLAIGPQYGDPGLTDANNLQWLSGLSSLQYLDLSVVDLSATSEWLQVINMLPFLLELRLKSCRLNRISSLINVNFTSLEVLDLSQNFFHSFPLPEWPFSLRSLVFLDLSFEDFLQGPLPDALQNLNALEFLDLSGNSFNASIPDWVYNITSLKHLALGGNDLQGPISDAIGNLISLELLFLGNNDLEGKIPVTLEKLSSLQLLSLEENNLSGQLPHELGNLTNLDYLSLKSNSFTGPIPTSVGRLSALKVLLLSGNKLNGTLPESLCQLSRLQMLSISSNSLEGIVTEANFENLTNLGVLDASGNSLVLKVSSEWLPPFRAGSLSLGSWQLGPEFPAWLQTQETLYLLDLSNGGISDSIPTWFWNLSSGTSYLDLSHNQIKGELPSTFYSNNQGLSPLIYLRSNLFEGPLPRISSNLLELDLSNNSLSGTIAPLLCNPLNEINDLRILALSDNLLSGELSQCWMNWESLKMIKLDNNNLQGIIPSSIGSLLQLRSLHLGNNSFYGEIPSSMKTCTNLRTLDLGDNKFSGSLPEWLGSGLPNLLVLRLRSNEFEGVIPPQLCHLTSLQVLDISHNNLYGKIPECLSNLSAMTIIQNSSAVISYSVYNGGFVETLILIMKGIEVEESNNLRLATTMDLSGNSFSGNIPLQITSLLGLRSLNLSSNLFTGEIPDKIGDMGLLESLDFSMNKLCGMLPQSMSGLNFLSYLNLSYNNLSGKIPSSTQLQSFSEFSYFGNSELCGPPLEVKCRIDVASEPPNNDDGAADNSSNGIHIDSFYVSMMLGIPVGFWGLWGVLLFKKSWWFSYFRFLDNVIDKLCALSSLTPGYDQSIHFTIYTVVVILDSFLKLC